ncbi:MAG TPA: hypothetical protein VGH10_12050 [Actinomycetota bacterium]
MRRHLAVAAAGFLLPLVACTSSPTTVPPPTSAAATATPTPQTTTANWRAIPKAPIAGRIGEGVAWSGKVMFVWGGVIRTGGGSATAASDGASYNPASNKWKKLPPAPSGVLGVVGPAAAWTGDSTVFWAGNSPDGPAAGAVYHPATGTWTKLPNGPLGPRESYASVWDGSEMLIVGGSSGDQFASPTAAAVAPDAGSWRLLPALETLRGLLPNGAVMGGGEMYLAGRLSRCPQRGSSCGKYRAIFLAYAPQTDQVHALDLKRAPVSATRRSLLTPVAWTGSEVVFAIAQAPAAGLVFYNPDSQAWRTGKAAPGKPANAAYSQTAWIGGRWVVPAGSGLLQIYDPASNAWSLDAAGPSPLNSRSGSAIAWTGSTLIAWSGILNRPGNPAPNTGSRIHLST